ncbi:PREDICTED: protein COBRA-like isoform X2 [Ipomoea nil]|uniref:protein COBRA-like isoform X2 n=1 Tax=Ipomoea nil TaxID=35883 RepID=UPI000901B1C4|nr:PREDICTED: protein COBRA-like isoform X2 [Ipomoea nil]
MGFSRSILLLLVLAFFSCCFSFSSANAASHDLNHGGNITINWDVISWTPDGYVAVVTIYNYQKSRKIREPGWTLGWRWAKYEVIWSMMGAQTTEQGDCSRFKGNIPHSCRRAPEVVDLLPGTPYNQQVENCCKGGVLSSWGKKGSRAAVSKFQLSVGEAGTTNKTVRLPKNFTFEAPGSGGGYACGAAKIVRPTRFVTPDGRRVTQAMMTWKLSCLYLNKSPKVA